MKKLLACALAVAMVFGVGNALTNDCIDKNYIEAIAVEISYSDFIASIVAIDNNDNEHIIKTSSFDSNELSFLINTTEIPYSKEELKSLNVKITNNALSKQICFFTISFGATNQEYNINSNSGSPSILEPVDTNDKM